MLYVFAANFEILGSVEEMAQRKSLLGLFYCVHRVLLRCKGSDFQSSTVESQFCAHLG
jgi:hypothetical protein